jgi:hypothetical protein
VEGGKGKKSTERKAYLWILMYLGHLTNLERSLLCWISPPILKFFFFFSKRWVGTEDLVLLAPELATTLLVLASFLT